MNMDIVLWMQGWRTDGVEQLFLGMGGLGEGYLVWSAIGAVFWLWGARAGYRAGWAWGLGTGLSGAVKWAFRVPRPWVVDSAVHPSSAALDGAGGYSFPSGHAAAAGAVWGGVAEGARGRGRAWLWGVALAVTVAVGISRVGLGVHTPGDVAAGAVLGWLAAIGAGMMLDWAEAEGKAWRRRLLGGGTVGLAAAACGWVVFAEAEGSWGGDVLAAAGALGGLGAAWWVERGWIRYRPEALDVGYRWAGMVLGEAGIWLMALHLERAVRFALPEPAWARAVVWAAYPLWVFAVWPMVLRVFREDRPRD